MRTKEEIEIDIEFTKNQILRLDRRRDDRMGRLEILKGELAELERPKPLPDRQGNHASIKKDLRGGLYVASDGHGQDSECVGPTMPTEEEAIEEWNKMMCDHDKPRLVVENVERFAIFPVKVKVPNDKGVVAITVDRDGKVYCFMYGTPFFNAGPGSWSGECGRTTITNAAGMILKIKKETK